VPIWFVQFVRFAGIGLVSNGFLYVVYLGLTAAEVGPKAGMTLVYAMGLLQTFVFNRRWTFGYEGAGGSALLRYGLVYAAGYVLNLAALEICVTRFHLAHQVVQLIAIPLVAVFTFLMQRSWVFRADS
jgi:putative flippase GtrA